MAGRGSRTRGYTSAWQEVVLARVERMRAEAVSVHANLQSDCGGDTAAIRATVAEHLDRAEGAGRGASAHGFFTWWKGAPLERAWLNIHAAEILVAELLPLEILDGRRAGVRALVVEALPAADARVARAKAMLADDEWTHLDKPDRPRHCLLRSHYAAALGWGYEASDEQHERVRSFRNMVLATTVALAVLAALLVLVGWHRPTAIPVCNNPTASATSTDGNMAPAQAAVSQTICPAGSPTPARSDLLYVELLGLTGGALAAAVAIRGMRGTSTPYSVPLVMVALKLPSGALTAVAGLLFIRAGFVPGLTAIDTQAQLLAYALLFGYAQQIFTRLVDDQAHAVLDKIPKSEPDSPAKAH
jgi:hypothetical protein